ncbi:permease [Devosia nitrariae]|uniref:ABC-2 type transport system permease protein n=1 Tax=Devosia nitrariae TaxID=2071872 RepID=A0ABQ5VYH6_9HYPH|nr:permease [Devosia nitrariae]GLQ52854.1 hypothetical protein GCM10010862_01120 [Devosia nitrariae]
MSLAPATTLWFARHELTLAWREFVGMLTGGRRTRGIAIVVTVAIAALTLHLLAIGLVSPWVAAGIGPDKPTLLLVSGFGMLFFSAMLSQGLESVTRAYYARSDLDLILSSPASARHLFAVRTAAVAGSTMLLACLLASPLIDALWLLDGPRWLAAYGVLAALGALSAAIGILVTIALFRIVGPKRTRLVSQIVAAVIGAGFVIGVQAAAILYYGSYSRLTVFQSADVIAGAPGPSNPLWIPARAAMGDPPALVLMLASGLGALLVVIALTASSYGRHAISAAGLGEARTRRGSAAVRFRSVSVGETLRAKEWKLLARDPWLLSQTLMQILYLLPPALLLWVNFGETSGAHVVVVPVLVMACGQLAGGLAWLAISGEDAHDLVATAPVTPRTVLAAKIEAVTAVVAVILAPLLALMALSNPTAAVIAGICGALAAASATAIQLWFRTIARRAMFRRRQVASRTATISEAFVSILWAGTGAVWAAGSWLAIVVAILAVLVLGFARLIAPRHP